MILLVSYSGSEGPMRARESGRRVRVDLNATRLRLQLGADEKRAELERVKKIIEQQRDGLKQKGLPLDRRSASSPAHR